MSNPIAGERAAGAIRSAALEVLETMFFVMVEPEPCASPDGTLCAAVSFSGSWSGEMEISIPEESSRAMTTDFLGLRFGEGPTAEQMAQVAGELMNMVCGAALSRLAPEGEFSLGPPRPVEQMRESAGAIRAQLELEDGPICIQLLPT